MKWKPTMEFRWLILKPPFNGAHAGHVIFAGSYKEAHVLQQKWTREVPWEEQTHETTVPVQREWRDVPTEE